MWTQDKIKAPDPSILAFEPPELWENKVLLGKPPHVVLSGGSPTKLIQCSLPASGIQWRPETSQVARNPVASLSLEGKLADFGGSRTPCFVIFSYHTANRAWRKGGPRVGSQLGSLRTEPRGVKWPVTGSWWLNNLEGQWSVHGAFPRGSLVPY